MSSKTLRLKFPNREWGKQFGLFLLIPCLFYLSGDIGRQDAAAAVYPSIDMIMINDGVAQEALSLKGDLPVPRKTQDDAAWYRNSLSSYAGLAVFKPEAVAAMPPEARGGLFALRTLFTVPDFKLDAKLKLLSIWKLFSIRNDAEYIAAQHCLAEAIYFESANEPERGQRAVAQVVLNRVRSGIYPSTVCGVIYQNAHRRNSCQFSYACDGKPERITDMAKWRRAKKFADDALSQRSYLKEIGNATHYHANYVSPDWRFELKRMKQIGLHIFYSMRGQKSV
jgi:hypothetical protein